MAATLLGTRQFYVKLLIGSMGFSADGNIGQSDIVNLIQRRQYQSGITVVWTTGSDTQAFCEQISAECEAQAIAGCTVYYSGRSHDAAEIAGTLQTLQPDLPFYGCSTCGEITPDGMQDFGAIAALLPAKWFEVSIQVIEQVDTLGMHAVSLQASEHKTNFLAKLNTSNTDDLFATLLIDGLTYSEEPVTAALARGLDSIPLIGGSAGDDLAFAGTTQIVNGRTYRHAAVVALTRCSLPFSLYTENNFVPTPHKLVVTESDPDHRKVKEFNAEPAALAYANAIGLDPNELSSTNYASHAVVVRVGGEYYCRAIQRHNDDQSLTFFCAIDNGVVLTVARSEGMVRSTQAAIERIEHQVGNIDVMLGFDCIYRKLDARHRNVVGRMESLYQEHNFVGFNTYGEQFNSMHINQTFTGVAFGHPR